MMDFVVANELYYLFNILQIILNANKEPPNAKNFFFNCKLTVRTNFLFIQFINVYTAIPPNNAVPVLDIFKI